MLTDDADRTLPPTDRRRREARLRGDVARSSELTSALVLLAASAVLWWLAPGWAAQFANLTRRSLIAPPTATLNISAVSVMAGQMGQAIAAILVPAGLAVLSASIVANVMQTGWMWTPSRLALRFRLQGILSPERCFDAVGLMCRIGVLGGVTWWFVRSHFRQLLSFGLGEMSVTFVPSVRLIGELFFTLSLCLVGLSLLDYGFRFWQNEQRLKMTVEERRREQRDDAVDPRFKQQRASSRGRLDSTASAIEPIDGTLIRK